MSGDVEAILETGAAAAVEAAASALAARGTVTGKCANCTSPLLGPYCAVCGQSARGGHRTVRELLFAFIKDFINFEGRTLRTGRALLFQPGELPKAFREGRTQPFTPPVRLYLFVSLIFFVLLGVTHIALMQIEVTAKPAKVVWVKGKPFIANPAIEVDDDDADSVKIRKVKPLLPITKERALRPGGVYEYSTSAYFFEPIGRHHSTLSAAARKQLTDAPFIDVDKKEKKTVDWVQIRLHDILGRIAADPAALNGPLTAWIPRALFLLLPLYALLLALFYIRRRKDFFLVDHLVFSFNIHTFVFVAVMVAAGLAQVMSGGYVALLFFAVVSLYIFLAMKRFYAQGWIKTTLKFLMVSGIYCCFFLIPALGVVLALSAFGDSFG
jgi:Protein of unknown function (DUF3667)